MEKNEFYLSDKDKDMIVSGLLLLRNKLYEAKNILEHSSGKSIKDICHDIQVECNDIILLIEKINSQ